jgi:hypothetical protein
MIQRYKLGKKPAVITPVTEQMMSLMSSVLDPLGPAPTETNNYAAKVTVPWPMYDNDKYGCCVVADTGHEKMLRSANIGPIIVPTLADVLTLYTTVSTLYPSKDKNGNPLPPFDPNAPLVKGNNPTDHGLAELNMVDYMRDVGWLGSQAAAVANINPRSWNHIVWCVQYFGCCRIGIGIPDYAEDQFDAGVPWNYEPSLNNLKPGGHDIPVVDVRGGMLWVISWGKKIPMTPSAARHWIDEAHAEVYPEWVAAQGVPGLDLDGLLTKMAEVGA